jgi:hypothetical protein
MQNKANFQKSQVNVKLNISRDYEKKSNWTLGENKPNSKPISKQKSDDGRQTTEDRSLPAEGGKTSSVRLFTFVFTRAFLLSHYLVEFCCGNDRMSLFKV